MTLGGGDAGSDHLPVVSLTWGSPLGMGEAGVPGSLTWANAGEAAIAIANGSSAKRNEFLSARAGKPVAASRLFNMVHFKDKQLIQLMY